MIARNRAIGHIRSQGDIKARIPADVQAKLDRLPSPSPDAEHMSKLGTLWGCLGRLQPEHRQAARLASYHGWNRHEFALHFNTPENTVKTWLRRGPIALRSCIEGD